MHSFQSINFFLIINLINKIQTGKKYKMDPIIVLPQPKFTLFNTQTTLSIENLYINHEFTHPENGHNDQYESLTILKMLLSEENTLALEREGLKRTGDNKERYKKLKQRLIYLSEQVMDQGMLKEIKDIASPNKSRLMRLAIQFEKIIKTQAKDYQQIQNVLKEIQKIIEHKRQHDLLILRQSKFMPTTAMFLKQFPSFHKNQATQSLQSVQLCLKLITTFSSLSSNKQFVIINNHQSVISTLLNCSIVKEQRKISIACLYILNSILSSPIKIQLQQLLEVNLEIIFCSNLIRRIRSKIEFCFSEENGEDSQFLFLSIKFLYLTIFKYCEGQFQRATYQDRLYGDSITKMLSGHFETLLPTLTQSIVELVMEKSGEIAQQVYILRQQYISNGNINILMYVFKLLNLIFHVDIGFSQKIVSLNYHLLQAIKYIFQYTKKYLKQSIQTRNLCSQIMIFLGNLSLENFNNQQIIRNAKLLQCLCNHPIQYLMQANLKNIFVSSLCSVIHNNSKSMRQAFAQNSAQPIVKFIQKQMSLRLQKKQEDDPLQLFGHHNKHNTCRTLSRKTSVSSMNSNYSTTSMAESFSTQASNLPKTLHHRNIKLQLKFRFQFWDSFLQQLKQIDD